MYLLYLDDSGSVKNTQEEYFVLGGVCIPEKSIYWLTTQLDELATEIHEDNPSKVEFHASEIFGGRNFPWNNYKKREERIKIIKKVLNIFKNAYSDSVLFACAVHKYSYEQVDPIEMAFEDLCCRFNMYLKRIYNDTQKSHKGLIILDKNAYETSLQKLSKDFRKKGTRWGVIKNIIEVPFFVDSKASRIIQLADHVSYAVFRRYNGNDLTYFNCIEDRFDSDQGIIHGLSHKQNYKTNCTCPGCVTRR